MKSEYLKTWHELMTGNNLDNYSNYGGGVEHANDYVILTKTRDSGILELSNYDCALEVLKSVADDVYTLSFNHWAVGWIEHIFVPQNSKAVNKAESIVCSLADYPVLDDMDFSNKEWEAKMEYWGDMSIEDRIYYCNKADVSILKARHNEIPEDVDMYIEVD